MPEMIWLRDDCVFLFIHLAGTVRRNFTVIHSLIYGMIKAGICLWGAVLHKAILRKTGPVSWDHTHYWRCLQIYYWKWSGEQSWHSLILVSFINGDLEGMRSSKSWKNHFMHLPPRRLSAGWILGNTASFKMIALQRGQVRKLRPKKGKWFS
jgi:hypothetical protein